MKVSIESLKKRKCCVRMRGSASLKPNLTFAATAAVFTLVDQFLGFSHGSHVREISLGREGQGAGTKRAGQGGGRGLNPPHTENKVVWRWLSSS